MQRVASKGQIIIPCINTMNINLQKVEKEQPTASNKQFLNLVTWQGFQNDDPHKQPFWNVPKTVCSSDFHETCCKIFSPLLEDLFFFFCECFPLKSIYSQSKLCVQGTGVTIYSNWLEKNIFVF